MQIIQGKEVFHMSKDNPPIIEVKSGEKLQIQTKDCFNNQVQSEEQSMETLDWDHINPATGPIYVKGAMPNDALKVTIEDIVIAEEGTMAAIPNNGVLGDLVIEDAVKRIAIKDGMAYFNEDIRIPCEPMIGVIGVAPKDKAIACGEPGCHGGNMDTKKIKKGSVLYLPVFVEGALLALGDVHACMGDGEVMVSGLEIPATVTISVEVIKQAAIHNPMLEDSEACYTIASDEDIEKAIFVCTYEMAKILMEKKNLSLNEAGMLLSAIGDLQFSQVVDPKRTVRMAVKKEYLASLF